MKQSLWAILCLLFFSACQNKNDKSKIEEKFDADKAINEFSTYKKAIEQLKDKKKLSQKLFEEIGLLTFDSSNIKISEAEIFNIDNETVKIDVRFFDGAPIGVKHWYFKKDSIIGIEVARLKIKDENPVEELLYHLYKDHKSDIWFQSNSKSENKVVKLSASLIVEFDKEWQLLKGLIQKFKQKNEKSKN